LWSLPAGVQLWRKLGSAAPWSFEDWLEPVNGAALESTVPLLWQSAISGVGGSPLVCLAYSTAVTAPYKQDPGAITAMLFVHCLNYGPCLAGK